MTGTLSGLGECLGDDPLHTRLGEGLQRELVLIGWPLSLLFSSG